MPLNATMRDRRGPDWRWGLLSVCTMWSVALQAEQPVRSATDEQVRSAFLFQLAQYVTWPESKNGEPLEFCVLGGDHLADMLAALLKGKSIQERPLTVRKLSRPEQLTGCNVAFLAIAKRKQLQQMLARWSYPPVLLVGEADGFAEVGGMVNLQIDDGRVLIEINLNATRRAGLDMRSQLLRLARIVPDDGGKP